MLAYFIICSLIVFNYCLKSATFPLSTELWRESVEFDLFALAEFVLAVPDLDMKRKFVGWSAFKRFERIFC